jgi:hypothetical protein
VLDVKQYYMHITNSATCPGRSLGKKHGEGHYRYEHVVPPPRVDWREKGVVGPVKDQHVGGAPCGCCWAFATIGVSECIVAMAAGKAVSLSEQQLIDCDRDGARASSLSRSSVHRALPQEPAYMLVVTNLY